ncbi:MAG: hypothetical protein U0Y82_16825 [Thermoleophilia bacterium]
MTVPDAIAALEPSERERFERALGAGISVRRLEEEFGVSRSSIQRFRDAQAAEAEAARVKASEAAAQASDVWAVEARHLADFMGHCRFPEPADQRLAFDVISRLQKACTAPGMPVGHLSDVEITDAATAGLRRNPLAQIPSGDTVRERLGAWFTEARERFDLERAAA